MTHSDSSQDAILAQMAEMRATLDVQQAIIAEQQAAIAALQQERAATPESLRAAPAPLAASAAQHEAADDSETPEAPEQRKGLTSRRSLLRGAAAATAAASVGAVALSGAQTAHAAPLADGDNLIIGATNAETSITELDNTNAGLMHALLVTTNAYPGLQTAIRGISLNGAVGVVGQDAKNGVGVYGYTQGTGGTGVFGSTSGGTGVFGSTSGGTGVLGQASGNGIGIQGIAGGGGDAVSGLSGDSIAVNGVSSAAGWGVSGQSASSYDFVANGTGIIGVNVQGSAGAPTGGNFYIGDCIRDANGDLWLCTAGDGTSVGTWVKVAHLAPGYTSGGAITYLPHPIRLLDTRKNATDANQVPGAPCSPSSPTTVNVAGVNFGGVQVPASASGAIGNVTVVVPSGSGYVALVPSGVGFQGTSNLNYSAGAILANSFNVGLNGGKLDVIVASGASSVDVLIDLFAVVS